MTWLALLGWLRKHWKTVAAAVVIGGILISFATLYSLLQIERGQNARLRGELEAKTILVETYKTKLAEVVAVNHEWQQKAAEWTAAVDRITASAEAYRVKLEAERARRRASEVALADLQAELDGQITSTTCVGALDQLIGALGWGSP